MRLPEGPWYRASRDAWYVEYEGQQVKLAKGKANKKAALKAFHRLMALGPGREYSGKSGADLESGRTPCKIWKAWKP